MWGPAMGVGVEHFRVQLPQSGGETLVLRAAAVQPEARGEGREEVEDCKFGEVWLQMMAT